MTQKLQLYKIRDFGAKINATVDYLRGNILPLLKVVLLIVVPFGLLMGIFFSEMFSSMMQFSLNPEMASGGDLSLVGGLLTSYLLMIAVSTLSASFMLTSIYTYMLLNDKAETPPAPMEVLKAALAKVPKMMLLMILITIVGGIGMVFFIIPGIYLYVTLSLALPILVFEDLGIGDSFSKSFKLIKGKWWSTCGLLVITGIIASVIGYALSVPLSMGVFWDMSSVTSTGDPSAVLESFSSWTAVLGMSLMMIASYVTYLIPLIALGFQYFNLSERVEGRGIRNQIDEFETVA